MDDKSEGVNKAVNLFNNGYNCSQSVVCAYCEELGISHEMGKRIASGFGGGLGGLRRTCGALTGAIIIAGLKHGSYDPTDIILKREYYQIIKDIEQEFSIKFSTSICKDLLKKSKAHFEASPMARTEEYYATRPCAVFVAYASEILESYLTDSKIKNN